jgi:hypothetical protein
MSRDNYTNTYDPSYAPASTWVSITPDDLNDLDKVPKALRFDHGGTIILVGSDGHAEPFLVSDGETLACRAVRVLSTGSNITTGIKALY